LKIAFLIHGKTHRRAKLIATVEECFGGDYDCECILSTRAGHFTRLTVEAIQNGASHIICIGGDGSLNETANGVMLAQNQPALSSLNWNKIRVGLIPAGTGNDFARTARLDNNFETLKGYIQNDTFRQFDLGLAQYISPTGESLSRYFVNI